MTTRIIGILAFVVIVLMVHLGSVRQGDAAGFKRGTSEKQLIIDQMVIDHAERLTEANEKVAATTKLLQDERDKHEQVRINEQARNQAISRELTRTRTERDGLRDQIDTALVTGGRAASDDTVAACHERAARASGLLADGLRIQEDLAGRAESCAADLRAMRGAWPRQVIIDGLAVPAVH